MHATLQSLASDALAVTQRLASRRGFGCRRGLEPGMHFSMRDSCDTHIEHHACSAGECS